MGKMEMMQQTQKEEMEQIGKQDIIQEEAVDGGGYVTIYTNSSISEINLTDAVIFNYDM